MKRIALPIALALACGAVLVAVPFADAIAQTESGGVDSRNPNTRAARNAGIVEAFRREYPLGRIGTLEDTAEAALWLASDSCFMTGENLQVNGGLTLRKNPSGAEIAESVTKHSG